MPTSFGRQGIIDADPAAARRRSGNAMPERGGEHMNALHGSGFQSDVVEKKVWRLSGFSSRDGREISHEFAGPHSGTDTVPFMEICLIGRDPELCHFVIDDPSVSRLHAELRYFIGKGVGLRDRGSRNRSFINGRELSDQFTILEVLDKVRFGLVDLTVSYPR